MSGKKLVDLDVVILQVAERLRDKATDDEIPFLTGDLRKSIQTDLIGFGTASIGSNLSYARAVHDGRPAITIKPNLSKNPRNPKKARLRFQVGGKVVFAKSVKQPARKGKPFLRDAAKEMDDEGYDFLDRYLVPLAEKELVEKVKGQIKLDVSL